MYHIAYCFDKNFNQHFGAAITSVILNFRMSPSKLHFHIITDQVNAELSSFIDAIKLLFGCSISVYVVAKEESAILERIPLALRNLYHFSVAAYFRLLLPALVPSSVVKMLYLDSDTIVIDDISKLIDTDLEGKALGLVLDPKSEVLATIHNISEYFNSGVALFDLQKWRSLDLANKCFSYLEKPLTPIRQADQCAINVILNGNIKKIDARWNGFTYNTDVPELPLSKVRADTSIIHFFTQHKPWHSWYQNGLGKLYWTYLDASPWQHPRLVQPTTVSEHLWLAKKLEAEGQFQQSNEIYSKVATHFLTKKSD